MRWPREKVAPPELLNWQLRYHSLPVETTTWAFGCHHCGSNGLALSKTTLTL